MKQKEIISLLNSNNRFILYGKERYFVEFCVKFFRDKLVKDFEIFNFIDIEQSVGNVNEIISKISAPPMMDNIKVVHIKNFDFSDKIWSKEDLKSFENATKNNFQDTIILISDNPSKNSKIASNIFKNFERIEFVALKSDELIDFIENQFEKRNVRLKKDIIKFFIDTVGYLNKDSELDLYLVNNMTNQIVSFVEEYKEITKQDIENLFDKKETSDVFKIIDAILSNNKEKAMIEFTKLRKNGEPTMKVMITIAKMFSTAVKTSYFLEEGYTSQDIAKELGKSSYAITSATRTLNKIGRKKLIEIIDEIIENDYKVKNGLLNEDIYGEITIVKIFDILNSR